MRAYVGHANSDALQLVQSGGKERIVISERERDVDSILCTCLYNASLINKLFGCIVQKSC